MSKAIEKFAVYVGVWVSDLFKYVLTYINSIDLFYVVILFIIILFFLYLVYYIFISKKSYNSNGRLSVENTYKNKSILNNIIYIYIFISFLAVLFSNGYSVFL